ncbi:MAG: GNAT family N-acetyltransferase [Acidobacteriota bacterium]
MTQPAGRAPVLDEASRLAARYPDEPRWVDLRGLLLSGRALLFAHRPEVGFIARSPDEPFAFVAGTPVSGDLADLLAHGDPPELEILVPNEHADAVGEMLPGWARGSTVLHRYSGATGAFATAPPHGVTLTTLTDPTALAAGTWSEATAEELAAAVSNGMAMSVAWVDGELAAFCAAPVETESLWDVWVETLPAHRRRGLASACFHRLRDDMIARGKLPVWGAHGDNHGSIRMAKGLGFVPAGTLAYFRREAG